MRPTSMLLPLVIVLGLPGTGFAQPAPGGLPLPDAPGAPAAGPVLIEIESSPPGAAVTVDGKYRGMTPLRLAVGRDEPFRLELRKAGFVAVDVRAVASAPRTFVVVLVAETPLAPRRFRMEWLGVKGLVGASWFPPMCDADETCGGLTIPLLGGELSLFPFRVGHFYAEPMRIGVAYPYILMVGTAFGGAIDLGRSGKDELRLGVHVTWPVFRFGPIPSASGLDITYMHTVSEWFRPVIGVRFLSFPPAGLLVFGFHL
jgi:hypothetical protein